MASNSSGQGTVVIPAAQLTSFIQQQVGLPTTFFLTIAQAKVNADGTLSAKYNFSNQSTPPPPTQFAGNEAEVDIVDADAPE